MSHSLARWQVILLALAVVIGLGLGATGLFAVGSRQWPWRDVLHVRAGFRQIQGVEMGTRVRVQGIEAGEVEAIEPPANPGDPVVLHLRLDGRFRPLVRTDARVLIASEGLIGGKVLEITPGTAAAGPVAENALLASQPTADLSAVLAELQKALGEVREGQGTVTKLLRDPQVYSTLLALLQQSQETLSSFQQDAQALKRLPVVRSYVEDPDALLIRPNCERQRQCFSEADLFEPGRAVLTDQGKERLSEIGPWLASIRAKGSEIVVASYADAHATPPAVARLLTQEQSAAVCDYLKQHHKVQKIGWFSSRKVIPLGLGTSPPPLPEKEPLPPARVEVLVFMPQQ